MSGHFTFAKAVHADRVSNLEWRLAVAFDVEEVRSRLCVHYRGGVNAFVNVLELQFGLIDILIERHFGFGVEPVVLNVPLDVPNGSDGGEHGFSVAIRPLRLRDRLPASLSGSLSCRL